MTPLNTELQKAVKKMRLSRSQEKVLSQVVEGLDNKTIAQNMNLSLQAIKAIVSYLLKRYSVPNRVSLVLKVVELAFTNKPKSTNNVVAGLPAGEMNVFN